jgi:ketosteroid isomerase-like protein
MSSDDAVFRITEPEFAKSLTGNKLLIWETWLAFTRGDHEAGLANMAEDVTWLIPGTMKTSGLKKGKEEVRRLRRSVFKSIFRDLEQTMMGIYGDGNVVVSELRVKGHLRNGQAYGGDSATVWVIENGKIRHVREYTDTQRAMAVNAVLQGTEAP